MRRFKRPASIFVFGFRSRSNIFPLLLIFDRDRKDSILERIIEENVSIARRNDRHAIWCEIRWSVLIMMNSRKPLRPVLLLYLPIKAFKRFLLGCNFCRCKQITRPLLAKLLKVLRYWGAKLMTALNRR
jgi:hypothetical protein